MDKVQQNSGSIGGMMKKIIFTLLILMLSVPCYASMLGVAGLRRTVPPTLTASGTVTKANTKLSSYAGIAFIDIGATLDLSPYAESDPNYYMVVFRDGTNKRLVAMIKDAGGGETYTDIIGGTDPTLKNGDFETGDPPATWTKTVGTISRQADPRTGSAGSYSGKYDSTAYARITNPLVLTIGKLYKHDWWAKTSAGTVNMYNNEVLWGSTTSATWANVAGYGTTGTDTNLTITLGALNAVIYADDVVIQSVDTPSITGVTLVNSKAGATYNVFSKQSGFLLSGAATATFTYEIRKY